MMKKTVVACVVAAVPITLSGCGGEPTPPPTPAPTEPPTPSPTETKPPTLSPTPSPTTPGPTPSPTPAPTKDPGCSADQISKHCKDCKAGKCLSCEDNYKLAGESCLASCVGEPPKPNDKTRPSTMFQYNGVNWPGLCINKTTAHAFAIGDWGGDAPGKSWENPGKCNRGCNDVDKFAQTKVADQMKKLAPDLDPDYVLNVGDNFYPGGVNWDCGNKPVDASTDGQFQSIWKGIYLNAGSPLIGKPWYGCLGNHDYGGFHFSAGWNVEIYLTWDLKDPVPFQWVTPAQYWSTTVQYADFSVNYFFLDSNNQDAMAQGDHRICQGGGNCEGFTIGNCASKLSEAWQGGLKMMEDVMTDSTAEYNVIVTHFPGPSIADEPNVAKLHAAYGISLIVTGHAHFQQLGSSSKGITYVITGGGGGITSDSTNSPQGFGYGFTDIELTREKMTVSIYNWDGVKQSKEVSPLNRTAIQAGRQSLLDASENIVV